MSLGRHAFVRWLVGSKTDGRGFARNADPIYQGSKVAIFLGEFERSRALMSNIVRSKIFVLRKHKYREADLIVHGLTTEGGKISLLARGALRSKKRFGGGILEPTHFIEIQYKDTGEQDRLRTLQDAILLNDFPGLRTNYDRLMAALSILETVSHVSQEGDDGSVTLFNLMGNALKTLEKVENFEQFKLHFFLKFLHQQGVLEVEGWMTPYLQRPISESSQIPEAAFSSQLSSWLQTKLAGYLRYADSQ
jgi:DNA repair protein RecO (recombination protein O)